MRHMSISSKIGMIGLLLLLNATWATPVTAGADTWTSIGPEGGSILCLAVDPVTPSIVYAGTYLGGVYKSTNGGTSWKQSNIGLGNYYVDSLLVDPETPSTLYALTLGGLYKSINSGGSWILLDTTDIFFNVYTSVVMDPQTPTTLYGSGGISSVYKTTDGGLTWNPADTGLSPGGDRVLGITPSAPTILYGWHQGKLHKTTNGGGSWVLVSEELNGKGDITSIVVDPATADTLYVVTANGVYKSTNGGVNWSPAKTGLGMTVRALVIDPSTPTTLYAAGRGYEGGVYKSTNGGGNWTIASTGLFSTMPDDLPHAYAGCLAINPITPSTLYVGLWDNGSPGQVVIGGGVYKSTNSAGSWSASNTRLKNTNISSLAVDPANAATIYGGTYPGAVYKTTNSGGEWDWWDSELLGVADVTAVVIDPVTTTTLYLGVGYGGVYKSTDSGEHWTPIKTGLVFGYDPAYVKDLVINPQNPEILYAGAGGGVLKTTNGGTNWAVKSTGLPSSINVEVLAIDPLSPNTVYAGGYMGGVYKTVDGGENWTLASTGLGGPMFFNTIYALAVDPLTPTTLYAGTPDDGVFKSINGGESWAAVNTGLPEEPVFGFIYANALAIDPGTPSTLYVGLGSGPLSQTYPDLEGGVFQSIDGGAHWTAVSTGLTDFFINELAISPAAPATIFAATQGGGIYHFFPVTTPPAAFNLTTPTNTGSGVSINPTLRWDASNGAAYYEYCLKTSNACDSSSPWTSVEADTSVSLTGLDPSTIYYWHVRAENSLGEAYANGSSSSGWSFTTGKGGAPIYLPLVLCGQ